MPRPKGSKNKIPLEVKSKIKDIVNNQVDKVEEELSQLTGKQYLDVFIKLLEYVMPKAKEEETEERNELPPIIIRLDTTDGLH